MRRRRLPNLRRWSVLLGLVAPLLSVDVAAAQTAASAAELFERGVADMRAGKPETGCPAIDESYRLDPRPGALFTAAECHASWGKLHAAVTRYRRYVAILPGLPAAQQQRHEQRSKLARAAVARLEPMVPRLSLVLPKAAGTGLVIKLDGARLSASTLAQPVLVDPGQHTLETLSQGGAPWRLEIQIALGESRRVELQVAPAAQARAVEPVPGSTPARPLSAEQSKIIRPLTWLLGGVAAAGLVTGSATGLAALHQKGIVEDECAQVADATGQKPCSPRGIQAVTRGSGLTTAANVSFVVGVVALVTGGVLLFGVADDSESETTAWRPTLNASHEGAWVGVSQRW